MSRLDIIIIAVGLAMDAFAVSVSCGLNCGKNRLKTACRAGFFFGVFQAGMTVIGWLLGASFIKYIEAFDHWVAFGLLLLIGFNMIREAFEDNEKKCVSLDNMKMIISLSIATSIDALAAGIGISSLDTPILFPALVIGIITMILSFTAVYIGVFANKEGRLGTKVDILGGAILIIIGLKILLEHLGII